VITARGTSEGLVLRIDGRVASDDLIVAVREFLESRRSFLSGNDVAFEWMGQRPDESVVQKLTGILGSEFSVSVRASKQKGVTASRRPVEEPLQVDEQQLGIGRESGPLSVFGGGKAAPFKKATQANERGVSLFDGIDSMEGRGAGAAPFSWDDPDARIVYGTLRSGQKIETEHSIVVFGDVNSGAEVIAGGDIVILGTLRGIAHAGAYDESGGGRVIFSLNLRPTQLRIGLVISRGSGSDEAESTPRGGLPEVARVDGNMIIVEPYQSRTVWVRRRE
jgi:septum formation inhibitor MinC